MARRPVFCPVLTGSPFVEEVVLDFDWYPGFAKSQAQKSIASLHAAAQERGLSPVLEISSKSDTALGIALSAFNLSLRLEDRMMSVEVAFQGSKVFEFGGPFHDLYNVSSRDAKTDARIRSSGQLVGFNLLGEEWPTEPQTCFYDWLYITTLSQHPEAAQEVIGFKGFSDIAFNPEKSLNCQARSAALFVALSKQGLLAQATQDKESYLAVIGSKPVNEQRKPVQCDLFLGRGEFDTIVNFFEPTDDVQIAFRLSDLVFPEPGDYRLQLFGAGQFLRERRFLVIPMENPGTV